MDWNKKLLYFSENQDFEDNKSNILDTSIVFIKDSNKIYTHGEEYQFIGWSVLEAPIVIKQFTVESSRGYGSTVYNFEEGMTFREFINSDYNIPGSYVRELCLATDSDGIEHVGTNGGSDWDYYVYLKPEGTAIYVDPDDVISDTIYYYRDEK